MFELFLLAIQGTTVTMMGHAFEPDVVVPTHIVRYCGILNDVDPYNTNMTGLTELKLYDCYSALMGFYDGEPLQIVHRLHNRTDKVGEQ